MFNVLIFLSLKHQLMFFLQPQPLSLDSFKYILWYFIWYIKYNTVSKREWITFTVCLTVLFHVILWYHCDHLIHFPVSTSKIFLSYVQLTLVVFYAPALVNKLVLDHEFVRRNSGLVQTPNSLLQFSCYIN